MMLKSSGDRRGFVAKVWVGTRVSHYHVHRIAYVQKRLKRISRLIPCMPILVLRRVMIGWVCRHVFLFVYLF